MKKHAIVYCLFSLCLVLCLANCKTAPSSGQDESTSPRNGIHVGIITFGPNAEDITNGTPVFLDRDRQGLSRLNVLLNTKYLRDENVGGTPLFYAAHMGLANMTKAQEKLPRLDHVIMVTFTDGLDVSSTGLTLTPLDDPGNINNIQFAGEDINLYQTFIKQEIENRKINGAGINSYVAAVRGDDITDVSAFEETLAALASTGTDSRGIPYVRPPVQDMGGLLYMFEQIANSLVNAWTEQTFTIVTPQYPRGTKIRMTFGGEENAQQAQDARLFVEGKVSVQDREYYLTDIRYGSGLNSQAGEQIKGVIEGEMVKYAFPLFTGYDLIGNQSEMTAKLRQWIMNSGGNSWQINSEYEPRPDTVVKGIRSNALVYLVLDKSSSIIPYDFPRVREAAKLFINMLHFSYYSY